MGDVRKFRRRRRQSLSHDWGVPVSKSKAPSTLLLVLTGLAFGAATGLGYLYWPSLSPVTEDASTPVTEDASSARFGFCHVGGGVNCVVDGDTFWFNGERIRIADIDTPETHPPRCAAEAELGNRATRRLNELLNAGPFSLKSPLFQDKDKYGRKLRIVTREGTSLGSRLVEEGLARTWTGSRRPWC